MNNIICALILLFATIGQAATLTWVPPTENADGTSLMNLAGYNIYYGEQSGVYTNFIDVGNVVLYEFPFSQNTRYVAITTYDILNNESVYSDEVYISDPPGHLIIRGDNIIIEGSIMDGVVEIKAND